MSQRHYFRVKDNNGDTVEEIQILGNHDYFDEEFYQNLGINFENDDDDYLSFSDVKINYLDFLYEWDQFLKRNTNKHGIPRPNYELEKCLEKENFKEYLYEFYKGSDAYILQPFLLTRLLANKYINIKKEPIGLYYFTLTCS